MMFRVLILSLIISFTLMVGISNAMVQVKFDSGTVSGEAVDSKATFTPSSGKLTITLENFIEDPNSVKQVIYGVYFEITPPGGNTGTATLDSISGTTYDIASGGTFTTGTFTDTSPTDWGLTKPGNGFLLDVIFGSAGQKDFGVIGAPNSGTGKYTDAGGSIAGNGPHNPFFALVPTFELSIAGVTADSIISNVYFLYNTDGSTRDGLPPVDPQGGPLPDPVPEPISFLIWGGIAAAACVLSRRHSNSIK